MAPSRGYQTVKRAASLFTSARQPRPHTHPSHTLSTQLRTSTLQARSFHSTRTLSSTETSSSSTAHGLLDSSISVVHSGIEHIHLTLGLPWWATLAVTAVLLRTTVVLPLQVIAQKNRKATAELTPAVLAARPELEREVISKYGDLGPARCTRILAWEMAKYRDKLRREAGIGSWQAWAPWAQFPVWLLAIETIRRMCGAESGLLGLIASSGPTSKTDVPSGQQAGDVAASLPGELLLSTSNSPATQQGALEQMADMSGSSIVSDATTTVTDLALQSTTTTTSTIFEPTLNTGGVLWFPDLLSPDPALVLPFALSAVLFASISWEERLVEAAGIRRPRWSVGLTRGLKLVALAVGPATLNMPSAMLTYWLTSASTALVQKGIVDKLVPIDRQAVADAVAKQQERLEGARKTGAGTGAGTAGAPQASERYVPKRKPVRRRKQ